VVLLLHTRNAASGATTSIVATAATAHAITNATANVTNGDHAANNTTIAAAANV